MKWYILVKCHFHVNIVIRKSGISKSWHDMRHVVKNQMWRKQRKMQRLEFGVLATLNDYYLIWELWSLGFWNQVTNAMLLDDKSTTFSWSIAMLLSKISMFILGILFIFNKYLIALWNSSRKRVVFCRLEWPIHYHDDSCGISYWHR